MRYLKRYADLAVLIAVPVVVFSMLGCAPVGEFFTGLAATSVETMPDPSTIGQPGGVTPTQFWITWATTLAMHEFRKPIRNLWNNVRGSGDKP